MYSISPFPVVFRTLAESDRGITCLASCIPEKQLKSRFVSERVLCMGEEEGEREGENDEEEELE